MLVCGCAGGTETGNPPLSAQLSYQAYSSDTTLAVGPGAAGGPAKVDQVWLGLGPVGFTSGEDCTPASAPSVEAPGLGVGDHATGHKVSTKFELAAGRYCALELPFTLAETLPASAPAELAGSSVLVLGSLADGTRISVRSTATPVLVMLADAGSFSLSEGSADTLIGFDVASWVAGVDWNGALRTDGAVVIEPGVNDELLQSFEANLAAGVELFRDRDGDGRLDENPEQLTQ